MECIQIIIHVYLFLGVKLRKFNALLTHIAPNFMIDPTIHVASCVILNPNILRENIAL